MINEHKLIDVDIKKIKKDTTNPNIMTDKQQSALQKTMSKFGYLAPIILDKKYKIIDGEHRVKIYEKLKKKTIPAYVIDVDKFDHKMLRQILNKLRGEHDVVKDTLEFEILKNADKLEEFSKLIAQPKQEFLDMIEYSEHAQIPEKEWQGMPEFMQPDEDIYQRIAVNFDTKEDVEKFAKQIGQTITEETRSLRVPYRPIRKTTHEWSSKQ